MSITNLSTEILQKIYEYAEIQDMLHLAQASKKNYRTYLGRRMFLLENAMHNSYSPLPSLYKLVIANEPDKTRKPMGTEMRKNLVLNRIIQATPMPKLTIEFIKKMAYYGKIAERWTEIYPQLRWRFGSNNRRLLHPHEKERLRGAIYHHWTYTMLFHDRTYVQYNPDPPPPISPSDPRVRLLRTYSTLEHIQLSEFLAHVIQLVELDLYPSNFIVQEHYSQRLPARALAKIAWGDGMEHRRLVRDIMKLSPADLLHLVDNTTTKPERVDFLYAQGMHFRDAPSTLNHSIAAVSMERARERLEDPMFHSVAGNLFFPSLMPALTDSDVKDEDVMFGIVDVEGADMLEPFRVVYGSDASPTGELGKACSGLAGPFWAGPDIATVGAGSDDDSDQVVDD